uniref:Ribosomal_S10 domain-containing protein n=1 Tax=Rhabditophanes sp. KR3021 TaxID=114890 RepID=A0AC35UIB0_9BILA
MLSNTRTALFSNVRGFATLRDSALKTNPKFLRQPEIVDTREFPEYSMINVCLQGYDFTPLESFQSYVHKIAKSFNFKVVDSYAVAAKTEKVLTYKPNSTVLSNQFELINYQRVVRIKDVPSVRLQLFIELLKNHVPSGVKITLKDHTKSDEDERYIPDLLLKEKQDELKMLDDPVIRKNLGWE